MAVSIFLKFDGPSVEGESVIRGHEKEIDVYGWGWGMHNSGSMHTATGGGRGKVDVQDIHISKKKDKSSPILAAHCCSGKHFEKATLTINKAGGDVAVPYYTLVMEKVIISSVSINCSSGDEDIHESISLNFAKYRDEYKPQSAIGVAEAGIPQTWDIAKDQA